MSARSKHRDIGLALGTAARAFILEQRLGFSFLHARMDRTHHFGHGLATNGAGLSHHLQLVFTFPTAKYIHFALKRVGISPVAEEFDHVVKISFANKQIVA